ncbi:MAG: sigma 54-interacting transcriptional regulator [Deltaproteobacteria bacterium]|nr:sigma 54-interacting transcriptional regulator [Deltaproteobacteria bacterium]
MEQNAIILDSIAEGVFTVDPDWRITFMNRAAQEITGIPAAEALGRPCCEVFQANICETTCILGLTLETGESVDSDAVEILRVDGREIPISVSTAILRDKEGQVIGGVQIFRDLSLVEELRRQVKRQYRLGDIISKSPLMQKVFDLLPAIARTDSTVLIQGESGTGKELVARALHHLSPRAQGPFVAVNCGALPDTLLESELFGHTAGAFTDARRDRQGRFAMAEGGTLFLDEIGDISPALQVRLLRVLEERAYTPLGASNPVKADVRIVTATHVDLDQRVAAGSFRKDLYYRINVVKLRLPRLAERKEDIPLLAEHFIDSFNKLQNKRITGLSHDTLAIFMHHDWPGNVRELENAIEHAFILCPQGPILPEHLPDHFQPEPRTEGGGSPAASSLSLKEREKRLLLETLERHGWRRLATARELGIDKNTLRRKIQRFGLVPPKTAGDAAERA